MGLRFRKSVKLAPGVRMNFSSSGIGCTIGPKGASIGIGKRGTYLNTGIPGTGLSARKRIGGGGTTPKKRINQNTYDVSITVSVTDDGDIYFKDENGNPLTEQYINAAKKQYGDAIRQLIQRKCDEINGQFDSLGDIHLDTPSPKNKPTYHPLSFPDTKPAQPVLEKHGLFGWLFGFIRNQIDTENEEKTRIHSDEIRNWEEKKDLFEQSEARRKIKIEQEIYTDIDVMFQLLEENLQDIVWPRETLISTEIMDDMATVYLDVDLPEIEDMPNKVASAPQRGYKLNVKDMPATQSQRLYMRHVHGIGFRLIGETFATLPTINRIVLSAFSQRPDRKTGHITDEYLYSVCVNRDDWSGINFSKLENIDVIEALSQFEFRRDMTKTGIFKPIEPFSPKQ